MRQAFQKFWRPAYENTAIQDGSISEEAYQAWLAENEPGSDELAQQREIAWTFSYRPLISIITPVYNPSPQALREALESVLAQTYGHWELCVVDGNSSMPGVKGILKEFASRDQRICVMFLEENLGIAGNSNAAMQLAHGEFVALLDHDDVLAPFALFETARLLNENSDWDLIYSDHDVLASHRNIRSRPLFKPDWSPEIMLSANYLTHLTVVRAAVLRGVGGFDPETDGAQDWDLFLRITEATQRVAHIPKMLYHWRDAAGSTAVNIWAKPYAPDMQLRVIEKHLTRCGLQNARAFFDPSGFIRVAWACSRESKVSIVIPSRGSNRLLERCVNSILEKTTYPTFEVVIVNNGAKRPETFDYYRRIARDKRVRVLHYEAAFNYSAVNNFGVRQAQGEILLFLNDDIEVTVPEWLDELVLWAQRSEVGVVGAQLLKPDGMIQHAGVIVGLTGFAGHIFAGSPEGKGGLFGYTGWYRNFVAVTGACFMVRRNLFEQVGGFGEEFQLCGSDVELCLRVRALGYRIVYNPFARLKHVESATHRGVIPAQDFQVSLKHYWSVLQAGDPFYNPNLSYWEVQPTLHQKDELRPLDFAVNFTRSQTRGG